MTAQSPEMFIYRSRVYHSYDEPLRPFLEQRGVDRLDFGRWNLSSCSRGYQGIWQITKSRLYLIALADPGDEEVDLSVVFPECETRVFAHWFSGIIRLPYGAQLGGDVDVMFEPENFEFHHELEFENGILIRAEDITNESVVEED